MSSVVESAITIVIFILMLGVLVIAHEFGHFVTARLAGVRVLEFGVGFPPRAKVLRSKGETLYTLNWLPIGGFVKLEGEDGDSEDAASFVRARLPIKVVILCAGVAMNLLLAFVIFFGIAWLANPAENVKVQAVVDGSPAQSIGIVPGDTITALNGQRFDMIGGGATDAAVALAHQAGKTVTLSVVHASGQQQTMSATLRSPSDVAAGKGALGVSFERSIWYYQTDPVSAVGRAATLTGSALSLIVDGLGQLGQSVVNHPTQAPPVAGPVGIAKEVGNVFWQLGPIFTLYLAGLLSANLALVNILPLPPLDGGRIAVILLRRIPGARISIRAEQLTYAIGMMALLALLAWITFFDITAPLRGQ